MHQIFGPAYDLGPAYDANESVTKLGVRIRKTGGVKATNSYKLSSKAGYGTAERSRGAGRNRSNVLSRPPHTEAETGGKAGFQEETKPR